MSVAYIYIMTQYAYIYRFRSMPQVDSSSLPIAPSLFYGLVFAPNLLRPKNAAISAIIPCERLEY